MKLRVKFNKRNYLKYISHLDMMRLFRRCFNRVDLPVEYSKGFNPQAKFSIASPLSLGIESKEEYMDIELEREISIEDFINKMNEVLPKDVQIIDAVYPKEDIAIASIINRALYEIRIETKDTIELQEINNRLMNWLKSDEIIISRSRKKGKKRIMKEENIRHLIRSIEIKGMEDDEVVIEALLQTGDSGNLRPLDFLGALIRDNDLSEYKDEIRIIRQGLLVEDEKGIYKPI